MGFSGTFGCFRPHLEFTNEKQNTIAINSPICLILSIIFELTLYNYKKKLKMNNIIKKLQYKSKGVTKTILPILETFVSIGIDFFNVLIEKTTPIIISGSRTTQLINRLVGPKGGIFSSQLIRISFAMHTRKITNDIKELT
jgi:hypothetical protein